MSKKLCLLIEGISSDTSNIKVINLMKEFGRCYVTIKDGWNYAYVDYDSDADATNALNQLNGSILGGQTINVRWWRRRPSNDLCKQFLKGKCRYGKDCRYVHSEKVPSKENVIKESHVFNDQIKKSSQIK